MLCMKADEFTTNGNFATGDFTGWTVTDATNFTFVSSGYAYNTVNNPYAYAALSGSTGVNATISQTLNLDQGDDYTVSFAYATDGLTNDFFGATFGGQVLLPFAAATNSNGYRFVSYDVTANTDNVTLTFTSRDDGGFNLLSNVSVQTNEDGQFSRLSPTPEPSSLLLVLPALGALLLRRRATR